MEKEYLFELGLFEIHTEEYLTNGGGTEIGYWLGYYVTKYFEHMVNLGKTPPGHWSAWR